MTRLLITFVLTFGAAACASAPPPMPVSPPFSEKMEWILRLEDRRLLREPAPAPPPALPSQGKGRPIAVLPPPPPDLTRLLEDNEARVRRRAALAIGRVGSHEGLAPLVALLADQDPEVRQMAAFALGLLGDRRANDPLTSALNDPAPIVRASAAEALGLIGDVSSAPAIGRAIANVIESGAMAQAPAEDMDGRRDVDAAVVRLGAVALARLKAYDALASAVLDGTGQPRVRWWPIAFALQQLENPRSLPALLTLATDSSVYTRAFAIRGLGRLKERSVVPLLLPLLAGDRMTAVEAMRALGQIGDPAAALPLQKVLSTPKISLDLRLEAIVALGSLKLSAVETRIMDSLFDALSDPSSAIRGAAVRALASLDPQNFVLVLSGLDPDPDWRVRAALAATLGLLPSDVALPRLTKMLGDQDQRVLPAVLASMVRTRTPNAVPELLAHLKAEDPAVRAAAARGLGELKPDGSMQALTNAYQAGQRDSTYVARAAALEALAAYGAGAAPALRAALTDKEWAVRVRAASLLKALDPSADAEIRPAPARLSPETYALPRLITPSVSTSAYIDTDRGTIQIELAVLDAPLTVENFTGLARVGFFDGLTIHRVVPNFVVQDGDPRGDGEGGPGYTIRDELNERSFVRGSVGMALDWADTAGSQFFITRAPQPLLDGRFTLFGRVVAGMEVVDAIQPGDVVRRVRVWDGVEWGR